MKFLASILEVLIVSHCFEIDMRIFLMKLFRELALALKKVSRIKPLSGRQKYTYHGVIRETLQNGTKATWNIKRNCGLGLDGLPNGRDIAGRGRGGFFLRGGQFLLKQSI